MSFGLRNAAQTFQRFIDDVLRGLDLCFAYFDDILILSRSHEEHEQYLRALFDRYQKCGININPENCVFRIPEIIFLGYKMSTQGYHPLEERVIHLQECQPPKTDSQLRRSLGILNYYRKFVPPRGSTPGITI
jgi:hypothetical protein